MCIRRACLVGRAYVLKRMDGSEADPCSKVVRLEDPFSTSSSLPDMILLALGSEYSRNLS